MLRDGLRSVGEDGERGASHGEMMFDQAIYCTKGRAGTVDGPRVHSG